jgi:hypothetical protein
MFRNMQLFQRSAVNIDTSYFRLDSEGVFWGNDAARSPWYEDYCHGGPVAGLAARAVEAIVPAPKALVRLTLDLIRPVPINGLRVAAEITREGRSTATAQVVLSDLDGKPCATGTSLHLLSGDVGDLPTAPVTPPDFKATRPAPDFMNLKAHKRPGFGDFLGVALPEDGVPAVGPKGIWMRTPPIVDGEVPSAFQKLCPLADCGNGISPNGAFGTASFINPDLTIVMHRPATGDWLYSDAKSHWQSSGIGLAQAEISDEQGPVATALQTLIVKPL